MSEWPKGSPEPSGGTTYGTGVYARLCTPLPAADALSYARCMRSALDGLETKARLMDWLTLSFSR